MRLYRQHFKPVFVTRITASVESALRGSILPRGDALGIVQSRQSNTPQTDPVSMIEDIRKLLWTTADSLRPRLISGQLRLPEAEALAQET